MLNFIPGEAIPHSITVNSLKYDTSNAVGITKMTNDLLGKRSDQIFNCVYSEAGHSEDLKTLVNEGQVTQLQNLRIISLPTFKDQKMKCTDQQGKEYLYLGYINGTFLLNKQFSVEDPHFYLRKFSGHDWTIDAVGKFYPCLKEEVDEPNAVFYAVGSHTIMKVIKNFQFSASWPQTSMTDHGTSNQNSLIHEIQRKYLHISETMEWFSIFERSLGVHTNVRDNKMELRWSPTSRSHKAKVDWVINKNEWLVHFDVQGDQWQEFTEDFFPKIMPYSGFEIEKLGKALPYIIYGDLEVSLF